MSIKIPIWLVMLILALILLGAVLALNLGIVEGQQPAALDALEQDAVLIGAWQLHGANSNATAIPANKAWQQLDELRAGQVVGYASENGNMWIIDGTPTPIRYDYFYRFVRQYVATAQLSGDTWLVIVSQPRDIDKHDVVWHGASASVVWIEGGLLP